MSRRDYGAGSCYQRHTAECPPPKKVKRKGGTVVEERPAHTCKGRWVFAFDTGWTSDGTRRRVTVTAKTKPEVLRKAKAKQAELDQGAGAAGTITVKAWAERWLAMRRRELRPSAYDALAGPIMSWVVPTIGARKVDKVTPADLRAVAEAMRDAGLASSSVHGAHKKVQQLLRAALIEGYTVSQRVLELPAPAKGKNDRQAAPLDQVAAVLDQARLLPDGGLRWAIGLVTGLRQGEVLGLTRETVDQELGLLVVDWQLQTLRYVDRRDPSAGFRVPDDFEARQIVGSYHFTRPKTAAGVRVVALPHVLADALRGWLMIAPENPWGLLWSGIDKRDGAPRPRSADDDRAEWYALQEAADRLARDMGQPGVHHPSGRHWLVHELRNNAATQLEEEGAGAPVITSLLGHTSIATSRGYMTARESEQRAALERVAVAYGLT